MRTRSQIALCAILAVGLLLLSLPSLGAVGAQGLPQKVIVFFHSPVTDQDLAELRGEGIGIRRMYRLIPAVAVEITETQRYRLIHHPRIARMVTDRILFTALDQSVPQIRADTVHNALVTGIGSRVCIVDTGMEKTHPKLPSPVAEHDFVNGDDDAVDDNGHGTHVAGIIASQDAVYRGVAPGAALLVAKVLDGGGSGYTSDVIAGIEWCVSNGADVVNLSLGGGLFYRACDDEPVAQAANAAVDQGIAVAAASGNNGYTFFLIAPACGSKVMAVGAVDGTDRRASFSNGGSELDLVAPGVTIRSTYLGGGFRDLSGTSMATPHVSAVVALLLQVSPLLSPASLLTLLRQTAKDLGSTGFDTSYGYGRVDALAAYLSLNGSASSSSSVSSSFSFSSSSSPISSSSPSSFSSFSSSSISSISSISSPSSSSSTAPILLFSDTFESGNLDAWVESGDPNWTVEQPAERQIPGKSASNIVAHADRCRSAQGCTLTLRNAIDASGFQALTLRFWRFVDRSMDAGEFLRAEAWNGISWETVASWTDGSGDDDAWHQESFSLPPALFISDLRIRFVSKESSSLEETEIDDVTVEGR